jgi:hypothetical protein
LHASAALTSPALQQSIHSTHFFEHAPGMGQKVDAIFAKLAICGETATKNTLASV